MVRALGLHWLCNAGLNVQTMDPRFRGDDKADSRTRKIAVLQAPAYGMRCA